jgi:uncharacterized protein (TIGR03067 family)
MQHALLILLLLAPSQGKEGKNVKDQEHIQGTWQLVSGERGGKALPEEVVKNVRLVFASDKLTTKVKDRANEATFKLRADTKPKEIDLDMDGNLGKGIYQLDGDTLKIAHGEVGEERPKEFPAQAGSGLTVMSLKRVKP